MNRLILFDVDGTLIDAGGAGKAALLAAFEAVFGRDDPREASDGVPFAGCTDPQIAAAIARALGIGEQEYAAGEAALFDAYVERLTAAMGRPNRRRRVLGGVVPLLEALDAMPKVTLGLLTGNIERGARIKLEPFGLNRYFPDGGFSSDHPDRVQIARLAAEKLSRRTGIAFSPREVTVVGDTPHDVRCAKRNGFRSVALDAGWVERSAIERADPDALLPDLVDTARALRALELPVEPGA